MKCSLNVGYLITFPLGHWTHNLLSLQQVYFAGFELSMTDLHGFQVLVTTGQVGH